MIKAIETEYLGYKFRSRLEARWAVFFEKMGWEWKYEHEGYQIGSDASNKRNWLPDFEIKIGKQEFYIEVKGDRNFFADGSWISSLDFGGGLPGFGDSLKTHPHDFSENSKPIMILGDVPTVKNGIMFVPVLTHRKGIQVNWVAFSKNGYLFEDGSGLYQAFFGDTQTQEISYELLNFQPKVIETVYCCNTAVKALKIAKAARFEHGEKP